METRDFGDGHDRPGQLPPQARDDADLWRRVRALGGDFEPVPSPAAGGEAQVSIPLRELVRLLETASSAPAPPDAMTVPTIPPDASLYLDEEPWQFDLADVPAVISGYSEQTRHQAARHVEALYDRFSEPWHELELIVLGLKAPAERHRSAREARRWLRHALLGVEYPLIRGLDQAVSLLRRGERALENASPRPPGG